MISGKIYKYAGLFIALVLPVLWSVYRPVLSTDFLTNSILRELCLWSLFAILLLIAKYGEKQPILFFTNAGFLKTAGLGLLIMLSLVLTSILYRIGYHIFTKAPPPHEALMDKFYNYPVWFKVLIIIRAGIVEETFSRAYGISRIQQLTNNKVLAFVIPLLFFSLGHYAYGTFNHIAGACALGITLTIWYLKTKNLAANMLGHALLDSLALFIDKT